MRDGRGLLLDFSGDETCCGDGSLVEDLVVANVCTAAKPRAVDRSVCCTQWHVGSVLKGPKEPPASLPSFCNGPPNAGSDTCKDLSETTSGNEGVRADPVSASAGAFGAGWSRPSSGETARRIDSGSLLEVFRLGPGFCPAIFFGRRILDGSLFCAFSLLFICVCALVPTDVSSTFLRLLSC